jgi:F-type H+-transporting ATPase subunit delta
MADDAVVRRYAAAFFNQEHRNGTLDQASTDLQAVASTLVATPSLARIAAHPLISEAKKKDAFQVAFGKTLRPATLAFINLLADHRRLPLVADIKAEFDQMVRRERNIAAATAVSAVPLTDVQKADLEKALEKRTGKDIELTTEVDPMLMGGVLVRIGDTVIDGTVKGKIERLREQLIAANR